MGAFLCKVTLYPRTGPAPPQTGRFLSMHAHPKAVVLHRDHHVMPSGLLAGRPSLLAYTGWMTSHGYNFGERDADRTYILQHALQVRGEIEDLWALLGCRGESQ
jgi:hypothetical protein